MSDERALLRAASERLAQAGIGNPRLEARVLWEATKPNPPLEGGSKNHDAQRDDFSGRGLAETSSTYPSPKFALQISTLPQGEGERIMAFEAFLSRREKREPVAYITGHREFWSLDFLVEPGILIPRPDTETLVEAVLQEFPDRTAPLKVIDFGTGSGCILAAILSEYPKAQGLGIDASPIAQRVASANLVRLGLSGRAAISPGNWAANISGRFDVVVSNPPYIPTADIAALEHDVRDYEPFGALDGGPDGLDAVRELAPALNRLGGRAFIEIGIGQAAAAAAILAEAGLSVLRIAADLSGVPRIVIATAFSGEKTVGIGPGTG